MGSKDLDQMIWMLINLILDSYFDNFQANSIWLTSSDQLENDPLNDQLEWSTWFNQLNIINFFNTTVLDLFELLFELILVLTICQEGVMGGWEALEKWKVRLTQPSWARVGAEFGNK